MEVPVNSNKKDGFLAVLNDTYNAVLITSEKEGLLKDVPVFGHFYKAAMISKSVSDQLFLMKLAKFIDDTNLLTDSDVRSIKKALAFESNSDLAELLILAVDNLSDAGKSIYIAQSLNLYSRSELTKSDFLRATDLIQKMYIGDLKVNSNIGGINGCTSEDLESMGLISLIGTSLLTLENISPQKLKSDGREEEVGLTRFSDTYFGSTFRHVLENKNPYSDLQKKDMLERGILLKF